MVCRNLGHLPRKVPLAYLAPLPIEAPKERLAAPDVPGTNARLKGHTKTQDYVVVIPLPPSLKGLVPRVELGFPTEI